MATAVAAAAIFATVASTAVQIKSSRDQAQAQKQAQRARQRLAEVRAARQRRQAIREARIRQAQVTNVAANTGTRQTSGLAGATGSLQSQLASNLSFLNDTANIGQNISIFNQRAASAQSRGQVAGAVGNLSSTIFQQAGGFGQLLPETKGNS